MGEMLPSDDMHSKSSESKDSGKEPPETRRDGIQQSLRQGYFKVTFYLFLYSLNISNVSLNICPVGF
jgi:hypothetical protein